MADHWRGCGFGLQLQADFRLPSFNPGVDGKADTVLQRVSRDESLSAFARPAEVEWQTVFDGKPFRLLRDDAGDYLLEYGDTARIHIGDNARRLRCWASDADDPRWQRLLLDTGLWCTSFLRGFHLLHAGAVVIDGALIAILSGTGGGKTSLVAELVRRGHALFADDVVALSRDASDNLQAHPAPPLMNLPAAPQPRPQASEIGCPLARFDDETWVMIPRTAAGPLRPSLLCVLQRAADADHSVRPIPATALDLLPYQIGLPAPEARRRGLFETFADLATTVPVVGLRTDTRTPPGGVAKLLVDSLPLALTSAHPGER